MYKESRPARDQMIRARFVRYLIVSLLHYKKRYCDSKDELESKEMPFEEIRTCDTSQSSMIYLSEIVGVQEEIMMCAAEVLSKHERFVLYTRVIERRPFKEIATDINMSYKGTVAVYYRAILKLRKYMRD